MLMVHNPLWSLDVTMAFNSVASSSALGAFIIAFEIAHLQAARRPPGAQGQDTGQEGKTETCPSAVKHVFHFRHIDRTNSTSSSSSSCHPPCDATSPEPAMLNMAIDGG
jgi:hypothetical protein